MKYIKYKIKGIQLIASENFIHSDAAELLGSVVQNKYAEGYPGKRYYGGCEVIDKIEKLCQDRLIQAYSLDKNVWNVNVQPLSGSPANFALYSAVLNPGDKLMGMALTSGGHLTHGFKVGEKKISKTSEFWESSQYPVDEDGILDYDQIHKQAKEFKPKLLIAGFSAYTKDLDYKALRNIADDVGAMLHIDMAHFSGLVAGKVLKNPFDYADFVTSTTHKSLRGPRSGLIFSKKEYSQKIDDAVFPGLQGGPHENQIAALATTLNDVNSPRWKQYCEKILVNSKALASNLQKLGYIVQTEGTENHIVLWNVKNTGISATKIESILSKLNIGTNKNTIPGDKSALNPSGIRLGSCSITTRGYDEEDCKKVVNFIDKAVKLGKQIQDDEQADLKLADFNLIIDNHPHVANLANEIKEFSRGFEIPNVDMKQLQEFEQSI